MEVDELETMREPVRLQHLARRDEVRRAQAELRVLAAARRPLAGAFAVQPHADADDRLDAHFLRDAQRLLQLLELLDDEDDLLAELAAEHRGANKSASL